MSEIRQSPDNILGKYRKDVSGVSTSKSHVLVDDKMFEVALGEPGLEKSWQVVFPRATECASCGGEARVGFVAFESFDRNKPAGEQEFVTDLHPNNPDGEGFWPHDCVAVAVYFCKECLETTALYNQA